MLLGEFWQSLQLPALPDPISLIGSGKSGLKSGLFLGIPGTNIRTYVIASVYTAEIKSDALTQVAIACFDHKMSIKSISFMALAVNLSYEF